MIRRWADRIACWFKGHAYETVLVVGTDPSDDSAWRSEFNVCRRCGHVVCEEGET